MNSYVETVNPLFGTYGKKLQRYRPLSSGLNRKHDRKGKNKVTDNQSLNFFRLRFLKH